MAEANVEALQRGYEALNRGDLSVVLELIDRDSEWHEPSPSPDAGTHTGRDSFDGFNVEPEQVFERDDKLIAVVHQSGRGRASGVQVDARLAHVWTVKDGRATGLPLTASRSFASRVSGARCCSQPTTYAAADGSGPPRDGGRPACTIRLADA